MSDREELHRAFPLESLGRELTVLAQQDRLDPVAVPEPLVRRKRWKPEEEGYQ